MEFHANSRPQTGQPTCLEQNTNALEARARALLDQMTWGEKIGQMHQVDSTGDQVPNHVAALIEQGQLGSVLNVSHGQVAQEIQRLARQKSRLDIPLLIARDVIHGFKTVAPIPLGQAASFNADLIRENARHAAQEASQAGINWTFSPMTDVVRDPRWGRVAESYGEDPLLNSVMGVATLQGYQGSALDHPTSLAACGKHFVGYGASEAGRDYNTTNIPVNELRNIYLPPFKAMVEAGLTTIMTSFGDIDGVPATANDWLLRDILRDEWGFKGVIVSDWDSTVQLITHGIAAGYRDVATLSIQAGIDIEMVGNCYLGYLEDLVTTGAIDGRLVDDAVMRILRLKLSLGLMDDRPVTTTPTPADQEAATKAATRLAEQSCVLLKNDNQTLPLKSKKIAVIGPLADKAADQLGTWVFDGDPSRSITLLDGLRDRFGDTVPFEPVFTSTRDHNQDRFDAARKAASTADAVILTLGEDAILSGEAHSRADISLPGGQEALINHLADLGVPLIAVIMAGRPLVLSSVLEKLDAILYAWHPGSFAGPAIARLLAGDAVPSGKLPMTFPRHVGQIPIYYNHKNTGRPPSPSRVVHIEDIPIGAEQTSLGMSSFHLDIPYTPEFPFGYGLSYSAFDYDKLTINSPHITANETLLVSVRVTNKGAYDADEIAQLYIQDRVGSITRPVRELKAFQRVGIKAGASEIIHFKLTATDLGFYNRKEVFVTEPGWFDLWVGGSAAADCHAAFEVTAA